MDNGHEIAPMGIAFGAGVALGAAAWAPITPKPPPLRERIGDSYAMRKLARAHRLLREVVKLSRALISLTAIASLAGGGAIVCYPLRRLEGSPA